ncbi:hypothetical protein GCM10009579_36400 [Streptomyces javensis]|uniref:Uncharacterized protein n=1 Tax=Streptomyces javensis TaxID=114698 RepID=A0ABP4HSK1_9ACTN
MTRFFAACVTQEAVGCAVAPRIRRRRLLCSITASTYIRVPDKVTVSKKSQARRASAWERRKSAHVLELRSVAPILIADHEAARASITFTNGVMRSPFSLPEWDLSGP